MGGVPGPAPAAHGGLLPRRPAPPRRADGRRRTGRRPLEPRRREPRTAAARAGRPSGVPEPRWPAEDDIDAEVRDDLDRWERDGDVTFIGADGPRRFAATRAEALAALDDFVDAPAGRVRPVRGRRDDRRPVDGALAALGADEPRPARPDGGRRGGRARLPAGDAPLPSAEGFVRQVMGWRDYVWHLYWHLGEDYRTAQPPERPAAPAGLVAGPRRRRDRRRLPRAYARRGPRPRLGPPHPAADGPRQLRRAARLAPRRGDRLVPPGVRRRLRLGDGAERRGHVAARRRAASWRPSPTSRAAPTSTG